MPPPFAPSFLGTTYQIPSFNPGDLTKKKGLRRGLAQQYGITQGLSQQQQMQRGQEFGTAFPGYQSLLDSGYSPEERAAIEQSTLGGISGSYGAAADTASRRMARTQNTAGYGSFLGELARSRGRDVGRQGLENQAAFASEKLRRKLLGLEGISKLYGVDTSFLNSLIGAQNELLGIGRGVEAGRRGKLGTAALTLRMLGIGG